MKPALHPRFDKRRQEAGFASIEFVAAMALSLFLVTGLSNIILMQYGRGVVRAAADESVRAGALVSDEGTATANAIAKCQLRQDDVLDALGKLGKVTSKTCQVANGQVRATISAEFTVWLPGIPPIKDTETALSVKEQSPR